MPRLSACPPLVAAISTGSLGRIGFFVVPYVYGTGNISHHRGLVASGARVTRVSGTLSSPTTGNAREDAAQSVDVAREIRQLPLGRNYQKVEGVRYSDGEPHRTGGGSCHPRPLKAMLRPISGLEHPRWLRRKTLRSGTSSRITQGEL